MSYRKGELSSIEVRANLAVNVPGLPRAGDPYHLYIVYTDHQGKEYFLRGGPERNNPALGNKPWGNIRTQFGTYRDGTIDWNPSPKRVQVYQGADAGAIFELLKRQFEVIGRGGVRYAPLGQNCNSCVGTALRNVGLPVRTPAGLWIPGIGTQLIDRHGRALPSTQAVVEDSSVELARVQDLEPYEIAQNRSNGLHNTYTVNDSTLTSLEPLNQAIAKLQIPDQAAETTQRSAASPALQESLAELNRTIANLAQSQQVAQSLNQEKQPTAQQQRDQMELT